MRKDINQYMAPVVIILFGAFISALFSWFFYSQEEKAIVIQFHKEVDERASSIYREVILNLEAVRSIGILFDTDTLPTQVRFSQVAANIIRRRKDIQALEWIPRVRHSERQTAEEKLQQDFPDFTFTERLSQGEMVVAKQRVEYYPVYYVEPLAGNQAALGFDLASNDTRLQALRKSRDLGIPQVTASITLVQESGNQKGFLAFLPKYMGTPYSIEQRQRNLKGFVLGVFRIGDIIQRSNYGESYANMAIRLLDSDLPSQENVLYTELNETDESVSRYQYQKELPEVWGRNWHILAMPTKEYIDVKREPLPLVIFLSGFLLSIAIAVYIRIISVREMMVRKQVFAKTHQLNELNLRLEKLSLTDALTGISNRRSMDAYLDKEWLRALREQKPISFILIDIDYFKQYNDHYGHLMGDECLKSVATRLQNLLHRPADMLARYGGEEFALILPNTGKAVFVADSCLKAVEALRIPHAYSNIAETITISAGVCSVIPNKNSDPSTIIQYADKALYQAKKLGRNRVEVAVETSRPNYA